MEHRHTGASGQWHNDWKQYYADIYAVIETCGAGGRRQVLKYERKSTKRARRESVEKTELRKSKVESEGMKYAGVSG